MYKVKVDMPGFDSFNDVLGTVRFVNGVSERPITEDEALRLGASVKLIRVDSNEQVGAAIDMVKSKVVQDEPKTAPKPVVKEVVETPQENDLEWTKEALEALAEEGGIKAVRKVAEKFDVKGVQISAMIDGILKAQTKDD